MPTIKKLTDVLKEQKKIYQQKYGNPVQIKDTSTEERSKFYNSKHWKKIRNTYIQEHPLCELSLLRGLTIPADCVHHCIKFYDQWNDQIRWKLLYDQDNLIALSNDMHNAIHKNQDLLDDIQKKYIREKKDNVSSKYLEQGIVINYTNDSNIRHY